MKKSVWFIFTTLFLISFRGPVPVYADQQPDKFRQAASVPAMAQSGEHTVYSLEDLEQCYWEDLKPADLIEVAGKKITIEYAQDIVKRDLQISDPCDPEDR